MSSPITVLHLATRFVEEWEALLQFVEDGDYEKAAAAMTPLDTLAQGILSRLKSRLELALVLSKKPDKAMRVYSCFECNVDITRDNFVKMFPIGTHLLCSHCRTSIQIGTDVDDIRVIHLEG